MTLFPAGIVAMRVQRSNGIEMEQGYQSCTAKVDLKLPEDNANQKLARSATRTGKLVVDLDSRMVSVDDRPVHLTKKEYGLLELLVLHKGTVVTREMFLEHLYGRRDEPKLKIIDVFVCKLRKKLAQAADGSHHIETVWGRGYVLRDPALTHGTSTAGANIEDATRRWQGHDQWAGLSK